MQNVGVSEEPKKIGTGDFNRMLKSLPKFSVFHVSKFVPDLTDAYLKKFLMEKLDISDEQLIVFPLVKKGADLTKLKFINFGLKIPTSLSSFVINPNLWPKDITVKPFKFSKNVPNAVQH